MVASCWQPPSTGLPTACGEWGSRCQEPGRPGAGDGSNKDKPVPCHPITSHRRHSLGSKSTSPAFSSAHFLNQLLVSCHLGAGPGSSFGLSLALFRRIWRRRAAAGTEAREEMRRHLSSGPGTCQVHLFPWGLSKIKSRRWKQGT